MSRSLLRIRNTAALGGRTIRCQGSSVPAFSLGLGMHGGHLGRLSPPRFLQTYALMLIRRFHFFYSLFIPSVLLLAVVGVARGDEFEIKGQYVWTFWKSNSVTEAKTNAFTVLLSTNSYKITTINIGTDLPCSAYYSGEDIASLVTGRQIIKGEVQPDKLVEMATMENGEIPSHAPQIIQYLWLQYAAGESCQSAGKILKVLPGMLVWHTSPTISLNTKVDLKEQPVKFVSEAKLFCSPIVKMQGAQNGEGRLVEPFNNGFLCGRFRVTAWREFEGNEFPSTGLFEQLIDRDQTAPNQATNAEDVTLAANFVLTTTSVKRTDEKIGPLACLAARTWLDDYRILRPYSVTGWVTNSHWLRLSEMGLPANWKELAAKEIARRDRLAKEPQKAPYVFGHSKALFLVFFMVSLAVPFLLVRKRPERTPPEQVGG
jgi:hypothetical protein